jgi:hypothetical protein
MRGKFVFVTTIKVFLLFAMPNTGECNDLLSQVESGSVDGVLRNIETLETVCEFSQNPIEESKKFLQQFITEINIRYGTLLTLADACQFFRENFDALGLPQDAREDFLMMIDLFQNPEEPQVVSRKGFHFHPPWEWKFFGLNKQHKNHYFKQRNNCKDPEFMLPTKMASGFVLALGGALLCLVPGAQPAGIWMIGAGVTLALDGLVEGERPYYKDSDTGEITPFGNPGP